MNDYGWLRYASRDQRLGNHRYRDVEESKHKRRDEFIYSGQRQHLLRLFRNVAKPDLCIGSGIGAQIKRAAVRVAKGRRYVVFDRQSDWSVEFPCDRLRDGPLVSDPALDPYFD